ncbi:MAG: L-ribulose-5-phosphate 4-epimerase [Fusobacteriaceae bacterium]|jgi:L-ribulose-5-phosphate 4-epimerase|nr:L-ribulose-5-phosphate 4-epimerase [Fusobacteriaceae bacterium]MBP6466923.1 L-ribulose-5-phosphate 4-epimerase [Fusobacteriaceae bacterium]MBP9595253.1 L-ribulose-5-phosphate 4-epimerase [Fusobacteriaceae bacterium]MBU9917381.1 L-ribulose-5-phosphate 4-epimerase [Fusobacteriaceae bacterium]
MLEELKERVLKENLELDKRGLVTYTWGNVSAIDREKGLIVIKPSGVKYEDMKAEHMVVVDLEGNVVEGNYRPSSDTATHIELYKKYTELGGVVHTHSTFATSWAQACNDIPAYGTTHADYFYGDIPCTRRLTEEEITRDYETETGKVIIETIEARKIKAIEVPGIVVASHGPFTWGKTPEEAVYNAVVLEEVAKMAYYTSSINPRIRQADKYLQDKHYLRKHGANAYYGQK